MIKINFLTDLFISQIKLLCDGEDEGHKTVKTSYNNNNKQTRYLPFIVKKAILDLKRQG